MRAGTLRWLALVWSASCENGDAGTPPAVRRVPASLVAVSSPTASVVAGANAGVITVKVLDAGGSPVGDAVVTFTLTRGGGQFGTPTTKSGDDGTASSTYRASGTAGTNEITVLVKGVAGLTFTVAGTAGAPRAITFGQRRLKYSLATDSLLATATVRDTFANATGAAVTWAPRDPTLIGVTAVSAASAVIRVLKRPGTTFLVATSGGASDSLAVIVPDSSSTPCAYQATPVTLALGASQQFDNGLACIRSTAPGAEYALVTHLGTAAYFVSQSIEVLGEGITAPAAPFPDPLAAASLATAPGALLGRDVDFELRMRMRESSEIPRRIASARAAFRARGVTLPLGASNLSPAPPAEGQIVSLNVNAQDFCSKPDARKGRLVAVTKSAIIVADVANPDGGFTDEEYRAFGAQIDTLITPVDTGAFGPPEDIDNNGRVVVFFTRAVNELTPTASTSGVVLGYYYLRDLLPRRSAFGECPGSNVGEMFYLLVPDPTGTVNANARTKAYVSGLVAGTIAHEYQHLINASRRMYVTDAVRVDEDVWLNEGLSHIAEELMFYRVAGLAPRANIDGSQLAAGSATRIAFDTYQRSNFGRYQQFLRLPESSSPLAGDDQLATRGATWSFLRYLADHVRPTDGDFWRKLVDSRWTGVANLEGALAGTGTTTIGALRDWATAVIADDNPQGTAPALQQPSWNFITSFAAAGGTLAFSLAPRTPTSGSTTALGLVGGAASYARFGVAQNSEALLRVTALGGGALPGGMRLTVVRIK